MVKSRNRLWPFGKLTGFSSPLGGLNWEAEDAERQAVRALILYLEERTTLYPDEKPKLSNALTSLGETRQELTKTIGMVPETSPAVQPLRRMRQAVTNFLQNAKEQDAPNSDPDLETQAEELAELRGALGASIATLVDIYGFTDVESCLASLFALSDEDKTD